VRGESRGNRGVPSFCRPHQPKRCGVDAADSRLCPTLTTFLHRPRGAQVHLFLQVNTGFIYRLPFWECRTVAPWFLARTQIPQVAKSDVRLTQLAKDLQVHVQQLSCRADSGITEPDDTSSGDFTLDCHAVNNSSFVVETMTKRLQQ
jgi:hypothetical protein